MKQIKKIVPFLFILLLFSQLSAQEADLHNDPVIDSLEKIIPELSQQEQISVYNDLASKYIKYSNEKVFEYASKALELAKQVGDKAAEGKAYYFIGFSYYNQAEFQKALDYYKKTVSIYEELEDMKTVARVYSDIGAVYKNWGQYEKAVEAYQKSLKIQEVNDDLYGKANSLTQIANVYMNWGENYYGKALDSYLKARDIFINIKHDFGVINVNLNIGLIYVKRNQVDKALKYYLEAETKSIENDYKPGQYNVYLSLGEVYGEKMEYERALEYTQKALKLSEEIKYDRDRPTIYKGMGELYQEWGEEEIDRVKYNKALEWYKQSIDLFKARGQLKETSDLYLAISDVYADLGMYEQAFNNHRDHKRLNDSIFNSDMHKTIEEMQAKYESEKKDLEIASQKKEIQRQNQLRNVLIGGFIIVLLFSVALYKQFLDKKKANVLLENQNDMLEEQNDLLEKRNDEIKRQHDQILEQKQSIEDSIHYASRIQSAVLPPEEFIDHILPEHFILFKPRDIVSGDYYWMTEKDNKTIVVAADCTGHGVPGAFMSMLGVSFLNEIVNKKEVIIASEILNELRDNVMRSLHQTGKEHEAKDGMDIALCILDKNKSEMQYAGAYNPLVYIRNGEVEQIKADKMPIGIYFRKDKKFTNHVMKIERGDCMYIYSDGFVDQFGGSDGKKYMSKRFKNKLLEIHQENMETQKKLLDKEIETWKGDKYPQIDDIVVIGFRIS